MQPNPTDPILSTNVPPIPPIHAIVARTSRLTLRPIFAEDRDAFIQMHEQSHTSFAPWSPNLPEGGYAALFDLQHERYVQGELTGIECRRVAIVTETGEMAGVFAFSNIVRGSWCSCNAGWRVNSTLQGQGICTEAMLAMLEIAFNEQPHGLGLHRVEAGVVPTNAASLRIAEKIGMRREGLAKRYLKINGTWQEHAIFAKTAEEHTPGVIEVECG